MSNIIISSLVLFLVFVTFSPGYVSSISINLDTNSSKSISCFADDLDPPAKKISKIQLYSPDKSVRMDADSSIKVVRDSRLFIIKVEGKIEKELKKSYLTIKMADIPSSHSGTYTCKIFYLDMDGHIHENEESIQLKINKEDVATILNMLRKKTWNLEREQKADKAKALQLEETIKKQAQDIKELQEKGDRVIIQLFKNSNEVGRLYTQNKKTGGGQTSTTLLLNLAKGDNVYPKVIETSNERLDDTEYYSVFSGVLIKAD